jgi:hypothetical protein
MRLPCASLRVAKNRKNSSVVYTHQKHAVFGQSFVDYLSRFLISKAHEFLISTDKSICDVIS